MKNDQRMIRGFAIISKGDNPKMVDKNTYIIPSQSSNKKYHVTHKQEWSCDCPDFKNRGIICKHIHAIQFWLKFNSKTEIDDFFEKKIEYNNQVRCVYCNSEKIKKIGFRKNKSGKKQ